MQTADHHRVRFNLPLTVPAGARAAQQLRHGRRRRRWLRREWLPQRTLPRAKSAEAAGSFRDRGLTEQGVPPASLGAAIALEALWIRRMASRIMSADGKLDALMDLGGWLRMLGLEKYEAIRRRLVR
jgi:hypothetical protein